MSLANFDRDVKISGELSVNKVNKKFVFSNSIESLEYHSFSIKILNNELTGYRCLQRPLYFTHLQRYLKLNVPWELSPRSRVPYELAMNIRFRLVSQHEEWIKGPRVYSRSMAGYLGFSTNRQSGLKQRLRNIIMRFL